MAITYPLQLPTSSGMASFSLRMKNARAISASPFTGRKQQYKWPLQVWEADVNLPMMSRERAEPWIVFLAKLNAGVSTDFASFYLSDPNGTPLGSQATNFTVNAGGDPNTVALSNLDAGKSGALLPGDYIRIGTGASARLHKVLDIVDADGSGNGEATIWPACWQQLDNTVGSNLDAYGVFTLKSGSQEFNINSESHYSISFTAEGLT